MSSLNSYLSCVGKSCAETCTSGEFQCTGWVEIFRMFLGPRGFLYPKQNDLLSFLSSSPTTNSYQNFCSTLCSLRTVSGSIRFVKKQRQRGKTDRTCTVQSDINLCRSTQEGPRDTIDPPVGVLRSKETTLPPCPPVESDTLRSRS